MPEAGATVVAVCGVVDVRFVAPPLPVNNAALEARWGQPLPLVLEVAAQPDEHTVCAVVLQGTQHSGPQPLVLRKHGATRFVVHLGLECEPVL